MPFRAVPIRRSDLTWSSWTVNASGFFFPSRRSWTRSWRDNSASKDFTQAAKNGLLTCCECSCTHSRRMVRSRYTRRRSRLFARCLISHAGRTLNWDQQTLQLCLNYELYVFTYGLIIGPQVGAVNALSKHLFCLCEDSITAARDMLIRCSKTTTIGILNQRLHSHEGSVNNTVRIGLQTCQKRTRNHGWFNLSQGGRERRPGGQSPKRSELP